MVKMGYSFNPMRMGKAAVGAYLAARGAMKPAKKKVVYKKKNYKKKVYKKPKGAIKQIKKQIRDLKKDVKEGQTTFKYRSRTTNSMIADNDTVIQNSSFGLSYGTFAYILQYLQYFDETTGSFVTRSFFDGSGTRSAFIKYFSTAVDFKNNYQVPCKVSVYLCTPKSDTDQDLILNYNANVIQNCISVGGVVASANPLIYVTDSDIINDQWNIKKMKEHYLEPGQCGSAFHSVSDIHFQRNSDVTLYQRSLKCFSLLLRVEGGKRSLGHKDDNASIVGYSKCGIDWSRNDKMIVEYEGGQTADRIFVDYTKNLTVDPVVSSKPVADNIKYSVA